jgi:hypothetical protein
MSWLAQFKNRLRALFGKKRFETDMAEELRAHLEMQAAANRAAGMDADEARYAARRQFGHLDGIKETARDQRGWVWPEQLAKDFRFAARGLARSPGFTAIALLTLALGLAVNGIVFLFANDFFLRPLPAHEPDQLVVIAQRTPLFEFPFPFSYPDLGEFRRCLESGPGGNPDMARAFSGLMGYKEEAVHLSRTGELTERTWVHAVAANVAGLLYARAATRERELAIRGALGASRGRLLRQLLVESVVLALGAGAVGTGAVIWVNPYLTAILPTPPTMAPPAETGVDWRLLAFTFGVSLVTGLLTGLLPALKASRFAVLPLLKEGTPAAGRMRTRLRSVLVIGQVALSCVVLVCAGLALRSLQQLSRVNLGFQPGNLLLASFDLQLQRYNPDQGRRARRHRAAPRRPGNLWTGFLRGHAAHARNRDSPGPRRGDRRGHPAGDARRSPAGPARPWLRPARLLRPHLGAGQPALRRQPHGYDRVCRSCCAGGGDFAARLLAPGAARDEGKPGGGAAGGIALRAGEGLGVRFKFRFLRSGLLGQNLNLNLPPQPCPFSPPRGRG